MGAAEQPHEEEALEEHAEHEGHREPDHLGPQRSCAVSCKRAAESTIYPRALRRSGSDSAGLQRLSSGPAWPDQGGEEEREEGVEDARAHVLQRGDRPLIART